MFPRRPAVPADLSSATTDQLNEYESALRTFASEARDAETATSEDIAELRGAAGDLGRVRAARNAFSEAAEALAAEAAAALAEFDEAQADETEDEVADTAGQASADTAGQTAPETDTAAAATGTGTEGAALNRNATFSPRAALPRSVRPSTASNETQATESAVNEWSYASGALRNVKPGERVQSLSELAQVIARSRNFVGARQPLATRNIGFSPETPRWLPSSVGSDQSVLNGLALERATKTVATKVSGSKAILAAGNSCSLFTPDYTIQRWAQKRTPLLDSGAVTVVDAPRGGVSWMKPRSFRKYDKAISDMPNADMCNPAAPPKEFIRLDCEEEDSCEVDAAYWFVRLCNLRTKTAPEQIEAALADIDILFAEHREQQMMDVINAASTAATFASPFGTEPTTLNALILAGTAMRKRMGMARDAMLDLYIEDHVLDALMIDVHALGYAPRLWATGGTNAVTSYIVNELNFRPVYLSTSFTASPYQTWSSKPQAAAAPLVPLPDKIHAFVSAPGAFIHPVTQEINFDMYRDSTLNRANEVELGYEIFEKTCFKGLESVHIEIPNCPSSGRAGVIDPSCAGLVGAP